MQVELEEWHCVFPGNYQPPKIPKLVVLCGSMRFYQSFYNAYLHFLQLGYVVTTPMFASSLVNQPLTDEQKKLFDLNHKHKIIIADLVVVIDDDNYVGESTQSEIEFAHYYDREVIYWSQVQSLT